MDQGKYQYKIQSIELENGNSFEPGRINVLVGANNCGKTQLLKDIFGHIIVVQLSRQKSKHFIMN